MADNNQAVGEFVRRLTGCQPRLYAYIMTLVLDPHEADDVLQQANLVMWEKLDEFLACENFDALACRVAYFQVLAYRRDRRGSPPTAVRRSIDREPGGSGGGKIDAFQGYLAAPAGLHGRAARRATRVGAPGATSPVDRSMALPPIAATRPTACLPRCTASASSFWRASAKIWRRTVTDDRTSRTRRRNGILLAAAVDGRLTEPDCARLGQLLEASDDARQSYVEHVILHAMLRWVHASPLGAEIADGAGRIDRCGMATHDRSRVKGETATDDAAPHQTPLVAQASPAFPLCSLLCLLPIPLLPLRLAVFCSPTCWRR